jgi:hypothetical protein
MPVRRRPFLCRRAVRSPQALTASLTGEPSGAPASLTAGPRAPLPRLPRSQCGGAVT